jgi:formylglycine-generating enzyme required for sulfatase activity
VAWTYANSGARTHPVGQKRPNGLGLFDMSGNVWEWCSDRYREVPGSDCPDTDTGSPEADIRVYRGGSWINPPGDARCSYRANGPATGRASNVGFRLARSID